MTQENKYEHKVVIVAEYNKEGTELDEIFKYMLNPTETFRPYFITVGEDEIAKVEEVLNDAEEE